MFEEFLEREQRREKFRADMLQFLKDEGSDTQAARNGVEASVATHDEHDGFRGDGAPKDDWQEGFLYRIRRDALHSSLNTRDILDAVERMEARQKRIDKHINWLVIMGIVALVMLGILLRR